MSAVDADAVAHFVAARARRPAWIGVPEEYRPATIEDGYRLQAAVHERLAAEGDRRVGYKIGSTSRAGQRVFGLTEPIYAGMFERSAASSISAALASPLSAPSLEVEIALVMKEAVGPGWEDATNPLAAIASGHIACEVIDNRYGDPLAVGVPSVLADDFFHAHFVLGPANPDWATLPLKALSASVLVDGERFAGNSADVLSAIDALGWLVMKLTQFGACLEPGDIVLTSSIVPPVAVRPPLGSLVMTIEGFAPLTLTG